MKKIAITFGAVLGLAMLGGCVGPYDSYDSGSYAYGPYDTSPYRYDTYYGPDYYADRPYYGGGYRAYNPGQGRDGRGDYRRGEHDGNRDERRDGARDGGRRDGQASQRPQQSQAAPRTYTPPSVSGVSGRTQAGFGPAPAPAAAAPSNPPPPSNHYGFQGRNPNDPNNTD